MKEHAAPAKRHMLLSAVGLGLQAVGSLCLLAAAIGIGKEINTQIRKTIIHELISVHNLTGCDRKSEESPTA